MTTPVQPGEILAGKYRVDKVLGVGGMGVVVAAHHLQLDERVALKFLLPDMLANREAVARFAREARAAVKIKSEHVARVSDVGTLENGAPYMVMEYLDGGDLSNWIAQRGALPVEQAVEFLLQACEAIAEAHALGIVHRDLKPANLFVIRRPDGNLSVKVLDFGISKITGIGGSAPDMSMTKTSSVMGSPLYMSPEQLHSSKDADARSDIWSLGVILFELVTGEVPFLADSMPGLVLRIMSSSPESVRAKRPEAPLGLDAVIAKCLDKDRGKRFQTVGEFAGALIDFAPRRARTSIERISGVMKAAGLSGSALVLPPSSDPTEPAAGGTQAAWGTTKASGTFPKTTFAALAIGAILASAGAFVIVHRSPSDASAGSAAPSVATTGTETTANAAPPVITPPASAASPSTSPSNVPPAAEPAPEAPATPAAAAAHAVEPAPVKPAAHGKGSPKVARGTQPASQPASVPVVTPVPAPAAPPAPAPAPAPAPQPKRSTAFDDRK